ncbi:MAG: type IV secretory system conjugative DNA transfer family protein [Sneathiella sp.]
MPNVWMPDLMKDIPRGNTAKYLWQQEQPKAHWQKPQAIYNSAALTYDPKNPQGKILFGALGDKLIGIADDRHILTVAGSRAGKTLTVDANLFFYDGNAVVVDPKGKSAMTTACARAALGQAIYIIDPFNTVTGEAAQYRCGFNFLDRLKHANNHIIEDVIDIVDAVIKTTGQEKDPHWDEAAGEFLGGLVLHIRFSPAISDEDRHLGTVQRQLMRALSPTSEEDPTPALQNAMLDTAEAVAKQGYEDIAHFISDSAVSFYEKADTERSSVLSTLRRHMKFLSFPAMRALSSKNSFDLQDLKRLQNGMTVYLVLPATRMGVCSRFLRLFINSLLADMERVSEAPKHPVLLILDEFPVLGYMRQLEDAIGQMASFDMKLWVILQDWGQGKALYKDRFESFAANAGILQAFGNVDQTTTEYLSSRLGKTPVMTATAREVDSGARGKGLTGRDERLEQFSLATPDEISRLFSRADPLKRQLILQAGYSPYIIQRVEHYRNDDPVGQYLAAH